MNNYKKNVNLYRPLLLIHFLFTNLSIFHSLPVASWKVQAITMPRIKLNDYF